MSPTCCVRVLVYEAHRQNPAGFLLDYCIQGDAGWYSRCLLAFFPSTHAVRFGPRRDPPSGSGHEARVQVLQPSMEVSLGSMSSQAPKCRSLMYDVLLRPPYGRN